MSKCINALMISPQPTLSWTGFEVELVNVGFSLVGGSFKNKIMYSHSIHSPNATINPTVLYGLRGIVNPRIEIDVSISATRMLAGGPSKVPNVLVEESMDSTFF